jgi:hypothetical protein
MTETLQTLLPILHTLSGAGAGVVASLLFSLLRNRLPLPQALPASPPQRLVLTALYSRRGARISVLALSGLIGGAAGAALAYVQGAPVLPVVDALLAALISQVWHAATDLSADLPRA